jgi:hypothetical protein
MARALLTGTAPRSVEPDEPRGIGLDAEHHFVAELTAGNRDHRATKHRVAVGELRA